MQKQQHWTEKLDWLGCPAFVRLNYPLPTCICSKLQVQAVVARTASVAITVTKSAAEWVSPASLSEGRRMSYPSDRYSKQGCRVDDEPL